MREHLHTDALLMWKLRLATGKYHHLLNINNYEKWVKENYPQQFCAEENLF
jgi:hypothetical protein